MGKQFARVNSQYGAPMGRREFGPMPDHGRKIRIFRVRIDSGGYDDGGAYWGAGKPLFCATDNADYRRFIRADSRLSAVAGLEIPREMLKAPPLSAYRSLKEKENKGILGASGVLLRQSLDSLGFDA